METILNNKLGETCIICEEHRDRGIHIFNQLICDSCERKLIETDASDERYKEYIKKLSKLTVSIKEVANTHHH